MGLVFSVTFSHAQISNADNGLSLSGTAPNQVVGMGRPAQQFTNSIMEKDKSILDFINKLRLITNFTLVEIVDYWDADLCAVGIQKGHRLVYINTFNYIDSQIIKYDYDF